MPLSLLKVAFAIKKMSMKKIFSILGICVTLIVVLGCKPNNAETKQLECTRKIPIEVSLPTDLATELNSFIVSDFKDAKGMIKVFDMETGKLKYQLAPKGEAKDEVLEASNFELLKDNEETWLYVYDLGKGKLLKYDFGNLANNSNPTQIDKLKSNDRYYCINNIGKGYAALGVFENHKFDLLNDSLKKYSTYGSYLPNKEKVSNKMIDAMANFGRSVVSSDKKILVNFSFAAGVLRFYDIKDGTLIHRKDAVVKPMNYKVKNDDYQLQDGLGFLDAANSDNYVYALYSGEKENFNAPMPTASYVYKYDYQGNLKDVYHLDKAAFTLAVKNDDSQLFTIVDDPNSKIFVYNLK